MGLEPTTFCMASSGEDSLSQQECGFPPIADAVGLLSISGDSDTIWTLAPSPRFRSRSSSWCCRAAQRPWRMSP